MPKSLPKETLLGFLCANWCPICGGSKRAFTWTCGKCGGPHELSQESKAVSETCDAHMAAADAFLALVRAHHQKPESD